MECVIYKDCLFLNVWCKILRWVEIMWGGICCNALKVLKEIIKVLWLGIGIF